MAAPDAPPAASLPPTYDPHAVEPDIARRWAESDAFHAEPGPALAGDRRPFTICIPPPNVTAALHLGHALNNTLQDVLTRYHRMLGDNTCWLPGTDHAGIATQTVVDKRLKQQGDKSLIDYKRIEADGGDGRGQFIAKVQAWKDEYEQRITDQLKAMGCSCDFDRQAFTMDDVRARAVREAFFRLFNDGLIYRGKRLVNWDPVSQTAIADDEVESRDVDGQFYYMKYPVVRNASDGTGGDPRTPSHKAADGIGGYMETGETVTVATTRPETMLGDTAVAVNPNDPQRAAYIGQYVRLPIANRVIPIVGDDYVVIPDPESDDAKARMASGFLKVTPAHDPNDWEIGQRHGLPVINVMAPDASISIDHGWPEDENPADNAELQPLVGLAREDARRAVVRWFRDHDLLADQKPYRHAVGHSYRSHVPVEPYLSDQWYVKVTDDKLAGAALRAMAPDQRTEGTTCTWTDDHPFTAPAATPLAPGSTRGEESGVNEPRLEAGANGNATADWEGELRFHPPRYAKTFQTWHENIRDWCISRQLWWGHRIPVWTRPNLVAQFQSDFVAYRKQEAAYIQEGRLAFQARGIEPEVMDEPEMARVMSGYYCVRNEDDHEVIGFLEAAGFTQDPDVLDTWFSSALWPMSTMGWPEATPELQAWNPTSVLCTAREIITLWVSRMVMFNLYFTSDPNPLAPGSTRGEESGVNEPRLEAGANGHASSRQRLPFRDVFIHAMIQDGHGQKMSKSLGNGVDPFDIIDSHGADAMRYTLTSMTTHTQDVRMPVDMIDPHANSGGGETFTPKFVTGPGGVKVAAPLQERHGRQIVSSYGVASGQATPTDDAPLARNTSEKFDLGRNFCNKVWNAFRFGLDLLDADAVKDAGPDPELDLASRWVLSRLGKTVRACDDALNRYEFAAYAAAVYDFFWRDLCDWCIEAIKPTVRDDAAQQRALAACLDASLRLLHPAMPFITERLWSALNDRIGDVSVRGLKLEPWALLCEASWPVTDGSLLDEDAEAEWALLQRIVAAIREVRAAHNVPPRQIVQVSSKVPSQKARHTLTRRRFAETLAGYRGREFGPNIEPPPGAASAVVGDVTVYVHDLLDPDTERQRLDKRKDEIARSIAALEKRLANKGYTDKAPAHLVQQTRDDLDAKQRELAGVDEQLAALL